MTIAETIASIVIAYPFCWLLLQVLEEHDTMKMRERGTR